MLGEQLKEQFEIGGTLDIGAGDRPIPQATVAADINVPTKPKKKPFKRPIKVIVDKTAQGALGLPLKLTKSHKLRVYWAGDATDMPEEWNRRFSRVFSDSAVGAYGRGQGDYGTDMSSVKMGREIASVLKPGGKVKIVANAAAGATQKQQNRNNARQIKLVKRMLKAGGLKNIKVEGDFSRGDLTFMAEKPRLLNQPAFRLQKSRSPRITPKRPRLRR